MMKSIIYFLLSFCITSFIFSQSNETIRQIEETGSGFESITNGGSETDALLGWTSTADAPEPFGRSIGGVIGNYAYVFGGQANSSMAAAYNISTNTWSASTVCTDPAYNAGFCVANNELYKISGSGAVSTFEKFTPDGTGTGTWTVLTPGPTSVMNAQNTVAWDGGDYIYVHSSDYSTPGSSFLERYSISGNSWTTLTPTTLIKRYAGLEYHNGFLYLIGGLVPTGGDQTACAKYEVATNTWSSIAPLPEAVNFCKWTTTTIGDRIVLVGSGGGYSTYPANPKIFYYDILTDTWTYDSDTPATRGLALAFFLPGENKVFFGGGNEGGSSTNYQATCWSGDGGFIPVELVSFNSSVDGNDVILNWITASELNNSHFEIQRSNNRISFNTISSVQGNGTTTEFHNYSYRDENLNEGIYYYRLKQVDYDGSFSYSNIVDVEIVTPLKFELSQNYPNPFNPSTRIQFTIVNQQFVSLKVYNVLGNEVAVLINEEKSPGVYNLNFDASELSSGTYFYKLRAGNFTEVKKMLLLK